MGQTNHAISAAEVIDVYGYKDGRPEPRVVNLTEANAAELSTLPELAAERERARGSVALHASFEPRLFLGSDEGSQAEEDAYFKERDAATNRKLVDEDDIDLTDDSLDPELDLGLGWASSAAPEHSSPVLLGEEDLAVNHFRRDRSVPADLETSLGLRRSVDGLFRLAGQGQVDFDGISSFQSDQALIWQNR